MAPLGPLPGLRWGPYAVPRPLTTNPGSAPGIDIKIDHCMSGLYFNKIILSYRYHEKNQILIALNNSIYTDPYFLHLIGRFDNI